MSLDLLKQDYNSFIIKYDNDILIDNYVFLDKLIYISNAFLFILTNIYDDTIIKQMIATLYKDFDEYYAVLTERYKNIKQKNSKELIVYFNIDISNNIEYIKKNSILQILNLQRKKIVKVTDNERFTTNYTSAYSKDYKI
jgi:hypothetical protein